MTFYFMTIGKEEYLLEFEPKDERRVMKDLDDELTLKNKGEYIMMSDQPDVEQTMEFLAKEGIIKVHYVRVGKVDDRNNFIRDARHENEEQEYCEF